MVETAGWILMVYAHRVQWRNGHGTYMDSIEIIGKEGYKAGPRDLYGKGVDTSPSLSMVKEYYAQPLEEYGS